jgi:hypothetical protein
LAALALAEAPAPDATALEHYLGRLHGVSRLYSDNALSFACEETIHDHSPDGRKDYKSFYVYRYDEEDGLSDFRLRYRFKPRKESQPKDVVDLADFDLPAYLTRAYSWIFIFEKSKRQLYRYELAGEERVFDRPAVRIRFEAIPPYVESINEWFGTAWVDAESSQLLRVQAYRPDEFLKQRALDRARRELEEGSRDKRAPYKFFSVEVIETEFKTVQNGMRFPTQVRIERRSYRIPGYANGQRTYLVSQKYSNYEFFRVRTAAEIQSATTGFRNPSGEFR